MLYYAHGDAIMTADEILHPDVFESLTGFFAELRRGRTPGTIHLPTGDLRAEGAGTMLVDDEVVPFNPIGLG